MLGGWRPETLNQWTHGAGFILSLFGSAIMLQTVASSGDPWRIVGCAVYAASLVALYAASTLSHSFEEGPRRDFYRMLDQVCIYLLVVGNFTPFGLVHLRNHGLWFLLPMMWFFAMVGIAARIRGGTRTTSWLPFAILGWLPVSTLGQMLNIGQLPGLMLVIAGGAAYSAGVWFLNNDHRRPYFHAVWHLSTITGSALHYLFVLEYVARTPTA